MNEEYDYFLSYSRDTCSITSKLIKALDRYNIRLWIDKTDVSLGCNIYSNIDYVLNCVKKWTGAIIIMDKTYFQKEWCLRELESFINNNILILPILHGITKNDIPIKYTILKKLNYTRLDSRNDLKNVVNNIILSHLSNYKYSCHSININHNIINILIQRILYENLNNDHTIINCSNLVKCLQIYLEQYHFIIDDYDRTLFAIIENKVSEVYKGIPLYRNDYILVRRALSCLLKRFNIIPNILNYPKNKID